MDLRSNPRLIKTTKSTFKSFHVIRRTSLDDVEEKRSLNPNISGIDGIRTNHHKIAAAVRIDNCIDDRFQTRKSVIGNRDDISQKSMMTIDYHA